MTEDTPKLNLSSVDSFDSVSITRLKLGDDETINAPIPSVGQVVDGKPPSEKTLSQTIQSFQKSDQTSGDDLFEASQRMVQDFVPASRPSTTKTNSPHGVIFSEYSLSNAPVSDPTKASQLIHSPYQGNRHSAEPSYSPHQRRHKDKQVANRPTTESANFNSQANDMNNVSTLGPQLVPSKSPVPQINTQHSILPSVAPSEIHVSGRPSSNTTTEESTDILDTYQLYHLEPSSIPTQEVTLIDTSLFYLRVTYIVSSEEIGFNKFGDFFSITSNFLYESFSNMFAESSILHGVELHILGENRRTSETTYQVVFFSSPQDIEYVSSLQDSNDGVLASTTRVTFGFIDRPISKNLGYNSNTKTERNVDRNTNNVFVTLSKIIAVILFLILVLKCYLKKKRTKRNDKLIHDEDNSSWIHINQYDVAVDDTPMSVQKKPSSANLSAQKDQLPDVELRVNVDSSSEKNSFVSIESILLNKDFSSFTEESSSSCSDKTMKCKGSNSLSKEGDLVGIECVSFSNRGFQKDDSSIKSSRQDLGNHKYVSVRLESENSSASCDNTRADKSFKEEETRQETEGTLTDSSNSSNKTRSVDSSTTSDRSSHLCQMNLSKDGSGDREGEETCGERQDHAQARLHESENSSDMSCGVTRSYRSSTKEDDARDETEGPTSDRSERSFSWYQKAHRSSADDDDASTSLRSRSLSYATRSNYYESEMTLQTDIISARCESVSSSSRGRRNTRRFAGDDSSRSRVLDGDDDDETRSTFSRCRLSDDDNTCHYDKNHESDRTLQTEIISARFAHDPSKDDVVSRLSSSHSRYESQTTILHQHTSSSTNSSTTVGDKDDNTNSCCGTAEEEEEDGDEPVDLLKHDRFKGRFKTKHVPAMNAKSSRNSATESTTRFKRDHSNNDNGSSTTTTTKQRRKDYAVYYQKDVKPFFKSCLSPNLSHDERSQDCTTKACGAIFYE